MRALARVLCLAGIIFCAVTSLAGKPGGGSLDPFVLQPIPSSLAPFNVIAQPTASLAMRTQTVNPAVRNLVIIVAGQSNTTNVAPTAYIPTNAAAIDNFNVYDGAMYAAADALVGCSLNTTLGPGNAFLRLADSFISAGLFDRVIIAPIGVSGTTVAVWQTGFASNRITVTLGRLAARGIVTGANVTIAVLWGQGETDNVDGTAQAAYTTSLNAIIAGTRAAGFTGPWFVARETYISGAASVNIQNAQAAVVDHPAEVWAGADADAIIGTTCGGLACRVADQTHWTDTGSLYYANAWRTAMALYGAPF